MLLLLQLDLDIFAFHTNLFRHVGMVKMICRSSNRASECGKKGDLSDFECGMVCWCQVLQFQKLLIYLDFLSLGFMENGLAEKKRKHTVSSSSVCENALLIPEVRGEWPDLIELIETVNSASSPKLDNRRLVKLVKRCLI